MPEPGKWAFLACGTWFLSSFASLEGGGLKCTRGGARGDRPLSGRRCRLPWVTCCVYCFLPGFGLWGIVDAQYILNTSSTSLSSHMPVCAGLVVWGMLDDATRGRCLIVLWGRGALSADLFWVHGSYGGSGLHAWLWPGRHLNLYIVFWTALHVVGVSLFCEAGERCVSGLALGARQLWWPWVACLAAAWEAFECVHIYMYIILTLCLQCMDIGIDGQWYGVRHFGFRGPVSLGAWSTWRGPWAAGRPEWRVNAGCVDVYIRELDARGE